MVILTLQHSGMYQSKLYWQGSVLFTMYYFLLCLWQEPMLTIYNSSLLKSVVVM